MTGTQARTAVKEADRYDVQRLVEEGAQVVEVHAHAHPRPTG